MPGPPPIEVPERPLDDGYRIQVFADSDEVTVRDVLDLWARDGAVPGGEAERRVHEVLLVATEVGGGLVGVSSAYLQRNAQLHMDLWYFRVFVAPDHRRSNVAVQLAVQARDLLEHRFVTGQDVRAGGIVIEVESEVLKRHFPDGVWRQTQYAFITENERGDHIRVRYFPGAQAPLPPGVGVRASPA